MDKIDRLKQKPVEAATNDKVSKGAEFDKKWKNVIIYFYCKTEFFLFKGMSLCQVPPELVIQKKFATLNLGFKIF